MRIHSFISQLFTFCSKRKRLLHCWVFIITGNVSFCELQQTLCFSAAGGNYLSKNEDFSSIVIFVPQKLSFQKVVNCFFLSRFFSVDRVENKTLALHKVTRSQMGSYLCIATNGYPPAVSKKVQLKVNCKLT